MGPQPMTTAPETSPRGRGRRMPSVLEVLSFVFLIAALLYATMALMVGRRGVLELIFGPVERRPVDFATLQLEESPNQYLVCPADFSAAKPHQESPVYDVSVAELRDKWFRLMENQPRVKPLSSDRANEQYSFEVLTPVIHFPDTVTVRFIPLGEARSTLAVYSRSHYGHSDLGVNRRRITAWLEALQGM